MQTKSLYAVACMALSAFILTACLSNGDDETQVQDNDYAVYDQSEIDYLTFKYPSDWSKGGGDIDFANVQEFDSLILLTFQSASKIGDSIDSPQLSGVETFDQFRSAFLSEPYQSTTYEDWSMFLDSIEVITYSSAEENGIYVLPEGPGVVALWQYGKKNYALVDSGSNHQEDGEFETFLKNISESQ